MKPLDRVDSAEVLYKENLLLLDWITDGNSQHKSHYSNFRRPRARLRSKGESGNQCFILAAKNNNILLIGIHQTNVQGATSKCCLAVVWQLYVPLFVDHYQDLRNDLLMGSKRLFLQVYVHALAEVAGKGIDA